jgi:nucleotide-binding universal stress UspA family protein
MDIRTVLLPIDFSPRTQREVALGVEVSRAFGARLSLLHNQDAAPLGLSRAWDWQASHREANGNNARVETALRELLASLPPDLAADATVSRGLVMPAILACARQLPADLIVVASHGEGTEDHTSIAEQLIAEAPCPVLAVSEGDGGAAALRLCEGTEALVPTDFSASAERAVEYAFELARRWPIRLRLLHVVPPEQPAWASREGVTAKPSRQVVEAARLRLAALVPEDLRDRVTCTVECGDPAACIAAAGASPETGFVVMGEHARGLRGLLTGDTARSLLRRAHCPVWFVPPRLA